MPGIEVNARDDAHKSTALIADFCQMDGIHRCEMKQLARFLKWLDEGIRIKSRFPRKWKESDDLYKIATCVPGWLPSSPGKMTTPTWASFSDFSTLVTSQNYSESHFKLEDWTGSQPNGNHFEVSLMGNSFSSEISAKNLGEGKHSWVSLEGLEVWGRIPVVFERKTWLLSNCKQ